MALVRDRFGQLGAGETAAAITPPPEAPSPLLYFFTAVAAGVTVFLITRAIDSKHRR